MPQTGWLTTQVCPLTDLEAKVQSQGVKGLPSLQRHEGRIRPLLLAAPGAHRLWLPSSDPCLCLHTASPSLCASLSFCPLGRHVSLDLGVPRVIQDDLSSRFLRLQRPLPKTPFPVLVSGGQCISVYFQRLPFNSLWFSSSPLTFFSCCFLSSFFCNNKKTLTITHVC